ncbi:MAG: DedA family protein [Magnetospirillum sp.]|nr:DedA family protein [Magnetospirillum sp.]
MEPTADIHALITQYGTLIYAIIFVWTFFEGETFVLFAGAAAQQGTLNVWVLLVVAWLGSFAGDQMWFWIGRRYGSQMLERRPKWRAGVDGALEMLKRYDTWFILSFRFIYGVRNFASFAMGVARVDPMRFAALNFVAAFVWAASFVGIGYLFGRALEAMLGDVVHYFLYVMLGVFVGSSTIVYLVHRHHTRKAAARQAAKDEAAKAAAAADIAAD